MLYIAWSACAENVSMTAAGFGVVLHVLTRCAQKCVLVVCLCVYVLVCAEFISNTNAKVQM